MKEIRGSVELEKIVGGLYRNWDYSGIPPHYPYTYIYDPRCDLCRRYSHFPTDIFDASHLHD